MTHSNNAVHSGRSTNSEGESANAKRDQVPEKKITSYYLDVEVIDRLKAMSDDQGIYYSTLVNEAIRHWVDIHGY